MRVCKFYGIIQVRKRGDFPLQIEDFQFFKKIPTLKTERLILRKIRKTDLDDIFEYSNDAAVSRYLLWKPHTTKKITKAHLSCVLKKYKSAQMYDWAIEYEGKMIGTCGFSKIDVLNDVAEVGYVLNKKYWGMGIAKEATSAVLNFGFTSLYLERIEVHFMEQNKNSLRVAEKCGMTFEGYTVPPINIDGSTVRIGVAAISRKDYFSKTNQTVHS